MCGSDMFSPLQSLAQNWCVCVCLISDPNAETPPLWKKTSQSGFWVCNEEREKRWHMELKSVPDSHLDCDVHQLTVGLVTHNNVQTLHPLPPHPPTHPHISLWNKTTNNVRQQILPENDVPKHSWDLLSNICQICVTAFLPQNTCFSQG